MIKPYNILFLGSGSSCRSQIAEGWAKWFGRPVYNIDSAGVKLSEKNDYAIAVMKEIGFDISDQAPEILTDDKLQTADIVITVCPTAEQHCPELPAGILKEHWSLESPSNIDPSMTDEESLKAFRSLRDDIKVRVIDLIKRLNEVQYQNFPPFPKSTNTNTPKISLS